MTWTLFDYGVGNLHSLRKALEACGAKAEVSTDAARLRDAQVAVLPGVGAFGHVMRSLAPAANILRQRHAEGRPILGICIGHQALYESSDESPHVAGLGILPGHVAALPAAAGKVPHMGWNTVTSKHPWLAGLGHVYYVHSYAAPPGVHSVATTHYGMDFSAADIAGNTVAFQFHPEKSGRVGLALLSKVVAHLEAA